MKEETGHIEPACDAHPADAAATDGGAPSASHTPGPWRVEQDGLPEMRNVGTYIVAGHRLDGALIADINTSMADARLIATAPAMRGALLMCADTFRFYARQHREKATPEGDEKAQRNEAMALMCERAMGHSQAGTTEQSAAPGGPNP